MDVILLQKFVTDFFLPDLYSCLSSPRKWPHYWSKHVCDNRAIKPEKKASVGRLIQFMRPDVSYNICYYSSVLPYGPFFHTLSSVLWRNRWYVRIIDYFMWLYVHESSFSELAIRLSHSVSTVALDRYVLATFHCLLVHWLPEKRTRAGGADRGIALRDWYIHGEQAGFDTSSWIRYINHSKTNTFRHSYRVQANICLGLVFMLTVVIVSF